MMVVGFNEIEQVIELSKLGYLFDISESGLRPTTTYFKTVCLDEYDRYLLNEECHRGCLDITYFNDEGILMEIVSMLNIYGNSLTFADCSMIKYMEKNEGILISDSNLIQTVGKEIGINVKPLIWINGQLTNQIVI